MVDFDPDDSVVEIPLDEEARALVKAGNYYVNQGSVFAPASRIRINFVPIILNVVIPWMLTVFLLTISVFRWRHDHESLNEIVWWSITWSAVFIFGYRLWNELHSVEAKWTRASACYTAIALLSGLFGSMFIYRLYMEKYYDIADLKIYPLLDVAATSGQDVMDVGVFYFTPGTQIDFKRSWHFKHRDVYCVAPLVRKDANSQIVPPASGSLDFFVVGKNCCSIAASDFRCPGYDNGKARAGVRILRDANVNFFRLAVEQGETTYGYKTNYPIFVEWVEDPVHMLENMKSEGVALYFILTFAAFVLQVVLVCICTMRFSLIGRKP